MARKTDTRLVSTARTAGWLALLLAAAGCGRAGGAPRAERFAANETPQVATAVSADDEPADDEPADADQPLDGPVARLERLRRLGQFEAFIDGALSYDDGQASGPLGLLKADALLAIGNHAEAADAALAAAGAALEASDTNTARDALRMWATARFRQQQSLDDPRFSELVARLSDDDALVRMLVFWRGALAGRMVYDGTATDDVERTELTSAKADQGSSPNELVAVEARINGHDAPLAFIDTGAQYTLMTVKAAEEAGVAVGPRALHLVGFAGVNVRPGVIAKLQLGELELANVPVLVGDSTPLVALDGQLSLGTELMHHVRFAIDYPAGRVYAEPAARRSFESLRRRAVWTIPVWTFAQACLARGQLDTGPMARVLVDTGNRTGTFVSARGRGTTCRRIRASGPVVFKFKPRRLVLDDFALGDRMLEDWPIADTMPAKLDRLDFTDLLFGGDVLAPYQVSIDLAQRALLLYPTASPAAAESGASEAAREPGAAASEEANEPSGEQP